MVIEWLILEAFVGRGDYVQKDIGHLQLPLGNPWGHPWDYKN